MSCRIISHCSRVSSWVAAAEKLVRTLLIDRSLAEGTALEMHDIPKYSPAAVL